MPYQIVILIIFCILNITQVKATQLTINLFSERNGKGLEIDQKILGEALKELGHNVQLKGSYDDPSIVPHAHINIFIQVINSPLLSCADINWFIPNPEYYTQELELLDKIDLILCRTKEVERIFQALNKKTYFLGFTSIDCYNPKAKKNFSSIFHLAGGSIYKGTASILQIWQRNPFFPHLTIIKHSHPTLKQNNLSWIRTRVDEPTLRHYQNTCGIHLCPSEVEGFGHHIMEAMSTGAVIVTTDAPPMNEFIKKSSCRVPYREAQPCRLGIKYYVDSNQLENTINRLRKLSVKRLTKMGMRNRTTYLQKTAEFKANLRELMINPYACIEGIDEDIDTYQEQMNDTENKDDDNKENKDAGVKNNESNVVEDIIEDTSINRNILQSTTTHRLLKNERCCYQLLSKCNWSV